VLEGGAGADQFHGGLGQTDVSYEHSREAVYVDFDRGRGFGGDAQGDTYDGALHGAIIGSAFGDILIGAASQIGGGGDDVLIASAGTTSQTGGTGADTYLYYGPASDSSGVAHDAIYNFDAAHDGFNFGNYSPHT